MVDFRFLLLFTALHGALQKLLAILDATVYGK